MSNFQFRTPANIQDFASNATDQQSLNQLWNNNLNGFIAQGMLGNPWNATNTPATTNYYNPQINNPVSSEVQIQWPAFPGRIAFNYPNNSAQYFQMADTGVMPNTISNNPCDPSAPNTAPYFPYGPRGWQDEYCEWAVTRNSKGQITRIDFTCENPEYWNSLWLIDPNTVLSLYQSILNNSSITLADLSLPNVTDPVTGNPIYNPLNICNTGPEVTANGGGAIHLTSTPNSIQTEIALASGASVLRNNPSGTTGNTTWASGQYNDLLCDAQYGQKNRNSDPNIGGNVNKLVNINNLIVTLADPPGLYIQMPDFSNYVAPDGSDCANFWTILRGSKTLMDQNGNPMLGNFILHAVFEVPTNLGYTVSDITILKQPILYGSQVTNTFKMQIVAMGYSSPNPKPAGYDAVGSPSAANTFAQPLQLFYEAYYNQMYNTMVPNPSNHPISLLSNSTFIPPTIKVGTQKALMVLTCATIQADPNNPSTFPAVEFDDPNILAMVNSVTPTITYAVPGNSLPSTYSALCLSVTVNSGAALGAHGIYLTNVGQAKSTAMPALLMVVL
jgi:hypothetical protein